jgi:hypothetical protein
VCQRRCGDEGRHWTGGASCYRLHSVSGVPELVRETEDAVAVLASALSDPQVHGLQVFHLGDAWTPRAVADSHIPVNIMPLMKALAQPVLTSRRLTQLSFTGLVVKDPLETSLAFAAALRSRDCQLRDVDLFEGHDACSIADALCFNDSVATLQWASPDLESLAGALKVNTTITMAKLQTCDDPAQGENFMKAIADFRGLRALRVPIDALRDNDGLVSLGNSLKQNSTVQQIRVTRSESDSFTFCGHCVQQFSEAIAHSTGFTLLTFNGPMLPMKLSPDDIWTSSGGKFKVSQGQKDCCFYRALPPTFALGHARAEGGPKWDVNVSPDAPAAQLINSAARHLGVSAHGLSLIHRETRVPLVTRQTLRQQLGEEYATPLSVSRAGNRAFLVWAWDQQQQQQQGSGKRKADNSPLEGQPALKSSRTDDGSAAVTVAAATARPSWLAALTPDMLRVVSYYYNRPDLVNPKPE